MIDRLFSNLGLAKKAGKLSLGFDASTIEILNGTASLVLVTSDLSPKTLKKIQKLTEKHKTELIIIKNTMETVEKSLGKRSGIIAVNSGGFAELIKKSINRE